MKLLAGYATDVGRVREGNEDSFVVDKQLALFAVADGMGGHLGGEVASRTAIETLRAAVASGTTIEDAVRRANAAVFERAGNDQSLYGMGTTLTAVVPTGAAELLIGHVGDSRAYLLRGDDLSRVTDDHSLVEELVREGRITEEQAAVHPQRSIITRALGVEPDVEVDLYALEVLVGDRILICSDGLTTMVGEPDVQRVLRAIAEPQPAAEQLIDDALEAGGIDNVTAIVIDVRELGDATEVDAITAAPGDETSGDADATRVLPATDAAESPNGVPATTPVAEGDAEADVAVAAARPSRVRRVGRALLWTLITLAPIGAVVAIGYVVINNDSSPSTTVPTSPPTRASSTTYTGPSTTVAGASIPTIGPRPTP